MSLVPEYVVLVWLARKLQTSVAWTEDRRENLIASFHSREQYMRLQGAFDSDAKFVALSAEVVVNIGAYSCYPTTCAIEPLMAMGELTGPYDVPAYSCVARGVLTNTCPMGPYRGVSRPVITLALERLMDVAAGQLGLDPVEIRRRNLIEKFPFTSVTGLVFDEGTYRQTLDIASDALDLPEFRQRQLEREIAATLFGCGICGIRRAHRLRNARLRGPRHGCDVGMGNRRAGNGSFWQSRAPDRRQSTRSGSAHNTRPTGRR